jgi:hypothetical protein
MRTSYTLKLGYSNLTSPSQTFESRNLSEFRLILRLNYLSKSKGRLGL